MISIDDVINIIKAEKAARFSDSQNKSMMN